MRIVALSGAALCLLMGAAAFFLSAGKRGPPQKRLLRVLGAASLLWGVAVGLFALGLLPPALLLPLFVLLQAPLIWLWRRSRRP